MPSVSDQELHAVLRRDPRLGWRTFIDEYTPSLLSSIERAGIRGRDEVMEVYVQVCEHLAAADCARLRRHDPDQGPLHSWLRTVVRNVAVDWIRSRQGRKRLFAGVRALDPLAQRVFELFYWRGRKPAEISELLVGADGRPVGLVAVFEALDRVERSLEERQRSELLSLLARQQPPAALESEDGELAFDPPDASPDPERTLRARESGEALADVLGELPTEDALVIWLRYMEGLTRKQVEGALHIGRLSQERLEGILARLRELLTERGISPKPSSLRGPP